MNKIILLAFVIVSTVAVYAAEWSSTKLEVLYGTEYEVMGKKQLFFSFTHASGWNYGDNFFFADVNRDDDTETLGYYVEWSPRISANKVTGKDLSVGILKDVSLAATFEFPSSGINQLYGVGVDLAIPAFNFFQVMAYLKDDPNLDGQTYQITSAWSLPVTLGVVSLAFDGFIDIAGAEDDSEMNIHTQPALALDVGNFFEKPGQIFLGVEYVYWKNKYGIKDVDENQPQAMIRWVF